MAVVSIVGSKNCSCLMTIRNQSRPLLKILEPDAHGLTVLPFWAGERSPGWSTEARGAILGLTQRTQPIEILRAAMEAIAYRFALIARGPRRSGAGGNHYCLRHCATLFSGLDADYCRRVWDVRLRCLNRAKHLFAEPPCLRSKPRAKYKVLTGLTSACGTDI